MKLVRPLVRISLAAALAASMVTAGAGCTVQGPAKMDAGVDGAFITTDDAGTDEDLAEADATFVPQGTLLASGDIEIVGGMPDGTIIYLAIDTKISLNAVAVTGGPPMVIAPDLKLEGNDTDDSYEIEGAVVALWTAVGADGYGKLQVWTKANGLKDAADASPVVDFIAGTNDGTRVGFIRKSGATEELVVAPTTFAIAPTVVQAALGRGSAATECQPDYSFAGTFFFSATCTGSATTAALRRTAEAGSPLSIVTGRAPLANPSDVGDRVFSWTRPGTARVYSIDAGGAVTSIAIDSGVSDGAISGDGTMIAWITNTGVLKSAPTATGTATTLIAAGGAKSIHGITGDWKKIFTNKLAPDADGNDDLQWSTVGTAATPTTLIPAATGTLDGFTATSSHVFYTPDVATGLLKLRPLAPGGMEVDLGKAVFAGEVVGTSKVVLGTNITTLPVGVDNVDVLDLELLDPEAAAPPKALVSAVQALTSDGAFNFLIIGNRLIFVEVGDGLYVKDLP